MNIPSGFYAKHNFYRRLGLYGATGSALGVLTLHDPSQALPIALSFFGACAGVESALARYEQYQAERTTHAAHHAAVVRTPPGCIGTIVNITTIQHAAPEEQRDAIADIFAATERTRLISPVERYALGYDANVDVFVTRHSALVINHDANGHPPDLILASARGDTLLNEYGTQLPLLKPQALNMTLILARVHPETAQRYPHADAAALAWDTEYDGARGHAALDDAYLRQRTLGAVIMDGPLALLERGDVVLPYGDYRYIGFDQLTDIHSVADAHRIVDTILARGVYDADKRCSVTLPAYERGPIVSALYEDRERLNHARTLREHTPATGLER